MSFVVRKLPLAGFLTRANGTTLAHSVATLTYANTLFEFSIGHDSTLGAAGSRSVHGKPFLEDQIEEAMKEDTDTESLVEKAKEAMQQVGEKLRSTAASLQDTAEKVKDETVEMKDKIVNSADGLDEASADVLMPQDLGLGF